MLTGKLIFIVEDNSHIAMNLSMAVEDLCGSVLGPVASVEEALLLVDNPAIDAAVLDCELLDRDITPVALHLILRDLPFVMHTGTAVPQAVIDGRPGLPVILKPQNPEAVLTALMLEIEQRQTRLYMLK